MTLPFRLLVYMIPLFLSFLLMCWYPGWRGVADAHSSALVVVNEPSSQEERVPQKFKGSLFVGALTHPIEDDPVYLAPPNTWPTGMTRADIAMLNADDNILLLQDSVKDPSPPVALANIFSDKPTTERDFLFFVHIPKTAGKSFHQILAQSFGRRKENDFSVISPLCAADPNCTKTSLKNRVAPRFDPNFAASTKVSKMPFNISAFLETYDRYDVALGHADVTLSWAMRHRRKVHFFTIVRDPVSRFFSFYDFLHGNQETVVACMKLRLYKEQQAELEANNPADAARPSEEQQHLDFEIINGLKVDKKKCKSRMVRTKLKNAKSLKHLQSMILGHYRKSINRGWLSPTSIPIFVTPEKFLEDILTVGMDNHMTKVFSGTSHASFIGDYKNRTQFSDQDLLRLAKANLDKFAFVGLQERFQESTELFLYTFGPSIRASEKKQEALMLAHRNSSPRKLAHSPELEARVREIEWMDYEIYSYVKAKFEKQYAAMRADKAKRGKGATLLDEDSSFPTGTDEIDRTGRFVPWTQDNINADPVPWDGEEEELTWPVALRVVLRVGTGFQDSKIEAFARSLVDQHIWNEEGGIMKPGAFLYIENVDPNYSNLAEPIRTAQVNIGEMGWAQFQQAFTAHFGVPSAEIDHDEEEQAESNDILKPVDEEFEEDEEIPDVIEGN